MIGYFKPIQALLKYLYCDVTPDSYVSLNVTRSRNGCVGSGVVVRPLYDEITDAMSHMSRRVRRWHLQFPQELFASLRVHFAEARVKCRLNFSG